MLGARIVRWLETSSWLHWKERLCVLRNLVLSSCLLSVAVVRKGSWGDLFSLYAVELQAFGFLIASRVLAQFPLLETTLTFQSGSIYQTQYPKVWSKKDIQTQEQCLRDLCFISKEEKESNMIQLFVLVPLLLCIRKIELAGSAYIATRERTQRIGRRKSTQQNANEYYSKRGTNWRGGAFKTNVIQLNAILKLHIVQKSCLKAMFCHGSIYLHDWAERRDNCQEE